MMEGLTSESSSLAGHQELGNLIVIYDQNHISIEDNTEIAVSEDVAARYRAYQWHVQTIDWRTPNGYIEDVDAVLSSIEAARAETSRPSLIVLNTIIGWPAPTKQNTGKAHGSALGADEIAATKTLLGFDPEQTFLVEDDVLSHARQVVERGRDAHAAWQPRYEQWRHSHPDNAALLDRLQSQRLPEGWADALPTFASDPKGMATRKASGEVLTALADVLPELWGGSADLAESNNTTMTGQPSFIPADRQTLEWFGDPYGRTLHFGIREHAMGAVLNGIALQSLTRAYGGTFLCFSDYMHLPVLNRNHGPYEPAGGAARGGYVLAESDGEVEVILIGTGSEVQIALDARVRLQAEGVGVRVVSMPCVEWFAAQDHSYRERVLPAHVAARVSVEAGVATGWERIVGDAGRSVSLEHFGASADAATLYRELGFTPEAIVAAAHESLYDAQHGSRPGGHPAGFAPSGGGTADNAVRPIRPLE